jgi:hypothetical protein
VPSNGRLTVTVSAPTFDPVINIVDGTTCVNSSAQACLAGAGLQTGSTEVATWDNLNPGPRTVFVVVERGSGVAGLFDVAFAFGAAPPPAYVKTLVSAACLPLTAAATTVPDTIGDGIESPFAALPFSFDFFGASVSSYSVSSDGYVEFSTFTTGTTFRDQSNDPIPNLPAPNSFAAPFWDDLVNLQATRTETFGAPGARRFVIEWSDLTLWPASSTERLTFQVQVVETSNVIEFHYCNLAVGGLPGSADRVTGSSATVGLEGPTGVTGVEHSYNLPSAVSTSQAIRFTP